MKTLVSLLFLIPVALDAYAFEPLFDTRIDYPLSDPASHLVSGDFNMDGYLDLAVAPYYKDSISILLGTWDGTFEAPLKYGTLDSILSLFAADFDNDADLDLAIIHRLGGKVSVMKNLGDGSFLFDSSYTAGTRLSSIWCADINNDSYNDIIVADVSTGAISILSNSGNFKFSHRHSYNILPGIMSVIAADFDNDGSMDIAGTGGTGGIQSSWVVLMNNGQGQFRDTLQFYNSSGFSNIKAGDLNGDGRSDIAIVGDSLMIYLNHGGDRFSLAQTLPAGAAPRSISICDLNGNGDNDLAVVDSPTSKIYTYFNNGNGEFTIHDSLQTSSGSRWISSGDFNSDGIFDLVVANNGGKSVSLFKNNGYGDFPMPPLFDLVVNPMKITCANLDGNEFSDLIIGALDSTRLFLNNGDLTFRQTTSIPFSNNIIKGKFNDDAFDDLALPNFINIDSLVIEIYLSDGTGGINQEVSLNISQHLTSVIIAADLNGDNIDDFLAGANSDTFLVILSSGIGSYGSPMQYAIPSYGVNALMAADLDSDGDIDLYVGNHNFVIFRNNGLGIFEQAGYYGIPHSGYDGAFAFDINSDNSKDLILTNSTFKKLYRLRNIGSCTFEGIGEIPFPIPNSNVPVIAGDLNCDGLTDLIHANMTMFDICPFLNRGDESFQLTAGYGIGTSVPRSLSTGDLNGDGAPDLVMVGTIGLNYRITALINQIIPQFIPGQTIPNLPIKSQLSQNYPNPFNAQTTIRYTLPAPSDVSIDIFDITGRKLETIISGHQDAGEHETVWNAADLASGIYFYKLKAGEYSKTEKCILLK